MTECDPARELPVTKDMGKGLFVIRANAQEKEAPRRDCCYLAPII